MTQPKTFGEALPYLKTWQLGWPPRTEPMTELRLSDNDLILSIAAAIQNDELLADQPVRNLFPAIPKLGNVFDLQFQATVQNQLLRFGFRDFSEVMGLSIQRFSALRHSGVLKTEIFTATLLKKHLNSLVLGIENEGQSLFPENVDPADEVDFTVPHWEIVQGIAPALSDINLIALYLHLSGAGDVPLVKLGEHNAFRVRTKMTQVLRTLTADHLLKLDDVPIPKDIIEGFIDTLSDPEKLILTKRLVQDPGKSLQEIGDELGVTRERARQHETKLIEKYAKYKSKTNELQAYVWIVREKTAQLTSEKLFLRQMPELKAKTSLKFNILDFFVGMGDVEREGEWIVDEKDFAVTTTRQLCEIVIENGVIDSRRLLDEFRKVWSECSQLVLDSWMSHMGYKKVLSYYMDRKTYGNLVYVALKESGKPMGAKEAMEYVQEEFNRSVENALASSPHFTKVSRTEWDLTSRATTQHKTIQAAIADLLDEQGSTPLDQVILLLSTRYKFKPRSIRSYATSPPFTVINGKVRRTNVARLSKKSPSDTKNLYQHGDALSLRVILDSEDMRGSGSGCPVALAAFLGIAAGQSRVLTWKFGDYKVGTSGAMFNLPSVKKAADDLGLGVGDQILLTFSQDEVTFRAVDTSKTGDALVREMVGLDASEDLNEGLARVLGLDPQANRDKVRAHLAARKETDLLELL